MRDEDLEEKAFRRFWRAKNLSEEGKTQKLLTEHNAR
jgi:hypothetical protein